MAKLGGYYYSKKRDRGLSAYAKKVRKLKKKSVQGLGKTKVSRGVSLRGKSTLVGLFFIAVIIIFILLFSNFFTIKRAVVLGNDRIRNEDIENILKNTISGKRFYIFQADNIILFNSGKIKKKILEEMPLVESVEIKRMLPNSLKIKILERQPFAIWETTGKKYLIDSKGIIVYEIKDNNTNNLPIIYDRQNKEVKIKGEATFLQQINFIRNILDSLKKETNLEVESVSLPSASGFEVDVKIKDGFLIYFNTERSVESQIRDLKSALEKEIADKKGSISYIDLRVENWIYYK